MLLPHRQADTWCGADCQVLPREGANTLEVALVSRPEGMGGGVTVCDVEVIVEYGSLYPSRL